VLLAFAIACCADVDISCARLASLAIEVANTLASPNSTATVKYEGQYSSSGL